ncbi:hypothetical protein GCM10010377_70660 [Streptomyces viridiviolaceus]|nr:hypothetical protein GCM10010377_70660 [Streptomyces viridiviolaceus]
MDRDHADVVLRLPADDEPRHVGAPQGPLGGRRRRASRYYSEDVQAKAPDTVDLVIVPGADHVDLYDRKDLIPFDRLDEFFTKNLA